MNSFLFFPDHILKTFRQSGIFKVLQCMSIPSQCGFTVRYLVFRVTMVISGDLGTSVVGLGKVISLVKSSAISIVGGGWTSTLLGRNILLLWLGCCLQASVAGVHPFIPFRTISGAELVYIVVI